MALTDDPKVAFGALRPVCVQLTREQTLRNVEQLRAQLQGVSEAALQQLQDYVLFPLRFVLKTPASKKERLIQAVVECIGYVLANTCVQKWDLLRDLFSELCLCLCSPTDPGKPAPVSDELKTAVLQSLDALLHAAYGDILPQLYEPVMLPGLGLAISLLLELAEREKSRQVQAVALKCLQVLLLQCNCPEGHWSMNQEEKWKMGSTFASFLPGISRGLSRVITGDMKQGHVVAVSAMRVWYKTVGLVMADEQLSDNKVREKPAAELGRVGELMVQRTPDWAKDTSGKLAIHLKKIIACTSAHQHWKVRLELVDFSNHLLCSCHSSLGECIGPLLEALVGLVNDENQTVREWCDKALKRIAQQNLTGGNRTLTDVLSENLHSLTTALPRLIRTSDDQHKLSTLNVFLGYLKMLGPQVAMVLNSAAHLQRISKALMQVLELDVTDVRIVEGKSSGITDESAALLFQTRPQRKHFQYFTDDQIFSLLRHICRVLGYFGNLYLLVDHFMDLYRESLIYRKQAALVLNEIIKGAAGIDVEVTEEQCPASHDDLMAAVTSIIEEYTSLCNWHLTTSHEESEKGDSFGQPTVLSIMNNAQGGCLQVTSASKVSTIRQMNSNIWQVCIQLEGIGCFALALRTEFHLLLITTLYPVLEKAGDESLLISQSAVDAMRNICTACGYGSFKDLINQNSDYLVNDISLNLQRLSRHPHTPCVLSVMFTYSDASLLPLVGDIIQDVLMALDHCYDERAPMFCTVLHSLMKALARWFPTEKRKMSESDPGVMKDAAGDGKGLLDVKQFFVDYRRQKELAEGNFADEEDISDTEVPLTAPEPDVDMEAPDVKAALPSHITIAKEVMERSIHLLSDPSLRLRLKVLDVLELCVRVLQGDERELLPMVHRAWPPLLVRLTNDDPLAVLRAFQVLCTLGETCGDFLRRRVSKDVLPRLTASLVKQAPLSAKAGPIFTHTLAYKLQLAVLEGLGDLCLRLDLADSDLDAVSEACLPYLSFRQPPKLQEACLSVFQHLIQVDPDAVWFTLNEIYCPYVYESTHPDLHTLLLSGMGKQRNEFTDNILKLLELIA
ncbi:TELO2-interacting protein 1 homolog [Amia ocellicauda]|uniref:TELO2-interacting protein 1 homolog n=1 Tax=Amia ocellicauda TaxID=2972642 RepID=UPI003463ABBF